MDMTQMYTDGQDLAGKVKGLMKDITADLEELVKIPSVFSPDDLGPVKQAAEKCKALLVNAGLTNTVLKDIGDPKKNAPLVYGTYTCEGAPAGTPTVMLYAHYDVVEAGGWKDAFRPEKKDGRLYGRGAADDKSGVMMHVGAFRAFGGKPPVHVTVVMEGEEECCDTLEKYVAEHPEEFRADVIVVADTGNYRLGEPTFTTALRGIVDMDVTVTTLTSPVHSGMYGGPVPDAFMVLAGMLARLHDDRGDVAVPHLCRYEWTGRQPDEAQFRAEAGMKDGVTLMGTGTLGSRLYTKPAVNVTGLDGPAPMKAPINQLLPTAKARLSLRIAPREKPGDAAARLQEFLESRDINPWNALVSVEPVAPGEGFEADLSKPGYAVARKAMERAYPGKQVQYTGQGGAVPLVSRLQKANPDATMLLMGAQEPLCRIHSAPESVSLTELESITLAECYLLDSLRASADATGAMAADGAAVLAAATAPVARATCLT
ncbi:M20/M25/M40 family metallo-hydrolase [Streptomyces sp. URMC 129]|uniref:M20/M25/M40 family metallo-hydrolase n=1 Tax=Streptomyces sp. URMC 129 TaxID=3423407 RepID=UPI003F1AD1DC